MRGSRFRFTLGHLIKVVAVCAVSFAVVRTPAWPLVLAAGPIVLGFAIDRARGGTGIWGAMLAGVIEFAGFELCYLALGYLLGPPFPPAARHPVLLLHQVFRFSFLGLACGAMVGASLWLLLVLMGKAIPSKPATARSGGPTERRGAPVGELATIAPGGGKP